MLGAIKCTTIFFSQGFWRHHGNSYPVSFSNQGTKAEKHEASSKEQDLHHQGNFRNHGVNRNKFRSTWKIEPEFGNVYKVHMNHNNYVTWINSQWCTWWTSKVIIRSSYIIHNSQSFILNQACYLKLQEKHKFFTRRWTQGACWPSISEQIWLGIFNIRFSRSSRIDSQKIKRISFNPFSCPGTSLERWDDW